MKWPDQAATSWAKENQVGRLCLRPANQMGTVQNEAAPPNTAFIFAPKSLRLRRILKPERSNYLIPWLSTARSCCALLPGRRMEKKLFSHLQNKVGRCDYVRNTWGGFWVKRKNQSLLPSVIWVLLPLCEPGKSPTGTDTNSPLLSYPPTPTCLVGIHPLDAGDSRLSIALGWCGGELESNQRLLWHVATWLLPVCPSYCSLRGPVEPLCGGGHVSSHPPHIP